MKNLNYLNRSTIKINFEIAALIRKEINKKEKTLQQIANEFGLAKSTVFDIKKNRTWKENV